MLGAVALLVLAPVRPAPAHERTAPWLEESSLDRGLYVEVRHPRVIRRPRAFDLSVLVANLAGGDDVAVEAVRFGVPGTARPLARRGRTVLPSRRALYERYRRLLAEAESGGGGDAAARFVERSLLRMQMAAGAFRDRRRVSPAVLPPVGRAFETTVEVDVVENGRPRTLTRSVSIPVEPALPAGADGSWFAGDQHLHTAFSIDAFFLDGTTSLVSDYALTADALGLDWIIVTDHTNVDFSLWYRPILFTVGDILAFLHRETTGYLVLQGQEMGVGATGPFGEPAHLLVYPRAADSIGFVPNPCAGLVFNHVSCEPEQDVIDRVNAAGGIGFIAHPFDSAAFAFWKWDVDAGHVGWAGLEIFNSSAGRFGAEDRQSLDWWHDLLRAIGPPAGGQLPPRPGFPTRFPVGLGNSDAHQPGEIGATFTYARLPGLVRGRDRPSRAALMDAFVGGRLVASNGPLVYGDVAGRGIGEVAPLSPDGWLTVTLQTTPELGPVADYEVSVLVDGVARVALRPSPDRWPGHEYETAIALRDLAAPGDRYVTLQAERVVCGGCPPGAAVRRAFSNPIWLEPAPR